MKRLLFLLLISGSCYGQTTYYIRSDSTRLQKVGGNNELILENSTKAVKGVLTNYGNGRTRFIGSRISGDTLFVGMDTLIIPGGSTPTWQQTLTAGRTGDSAFIDNGVSGESYSIRTRNIALGFPIVTFKPVSANKNIAFDIMPTGTPGNYSDNGIAWVDVCNVNVSESSDPVSTARVGVTTSAAQFGSRAFNGGPVLPVEIIVDTDKRMTLSTSNTATFNIGKITQSQSVSGDYVGYSLINSNNSVAESNPIFFIGNDIASNKFGYLRWNNNASPTTLNRKPNQLEIATNYGATNGIAFSTSIVSGSVYAPMDFYQIIGAVSQRRARLDSLGHWTFGVSSLNYTPAILHSIGTTEQLRVGYDVSNYMSTTVGSTGKVTWDAVGSGAGFVINDVSDFADTTNFKPVVINTTGTGGTTNQLYKATYWPGGGGGGGGSTFIQYAIAYVDTLGNDGTGVVGNINLPFLTINAAQAALPSWGGKIKIGIGTFNSPDSVRSHVTLEGTKKPEYNWVATAATDTTTTYTAPTKLINGTILRGTVGGGTLLKTEVKIYNLGVDCGSLFVSGGGTEGNGIAFGQNNTGATTPYQLSTGMEVKNVIILGKDASSSFHCLNIETVLNPVIEDVTTCYSTFGIVLKSVGGTINNVHCYSHANSGIIFKYNAYAVASKVSINNFYISSIASKEGGGLQVLGISSSQTGNVDVTISNGHVNDCSYGIKTLDALNTVITNVTAAYNSANGFDIGSEATMVNCIAHHNTSNGFYLIPSTGSNMTMTFMTSCRAYSNQLAGINSSPTNNNRVMIGFTESSYNGTYGVVGAGETYKMGYCQMEGNTTASVSGTFTELFVTVDGTQTLTNKTLDGITYLGSPTHKTWSSYSSVLQGATSSIFNGTVTDFMLLSNIYYNAGFKYQTTAPGAKIFMYNGTITHSVFASGSADASATPIDALSINNSGAIQFNQYGAGTLVTDGSGNITATSDKKVKHDINDFRLGLSQLKKVRPTTYIRNADKSNSVEVGFIAQNIQQAFGGLGVGHDANGMLTLNTNVILAASVNAIQEISDRLDRVEKENKELKELVKRLLNK